jgi:hypothetical protein
MRYRLRTLMIVLAKYRPQITLMLGLVGVMTAYGCWLGCEYHGWPAVLMPPAIFLGVASVAAITEGVWRLED